MIFWLDAQISPKLTGWFKHKFNHDCVAIRDLGQINAKDHAIFLNAKAAGAIVITKDKDFVDLVLADGPPPQILWITCGNTSNAKLQEILESSLPTAIKLFEQGEPLVEITEEA